ncbi:MAG: hypothetical protein H0U58_05380 [Chloroflexi bacterium]|nr:hypothetical protein [Chloroflexota bacterium]
MADGTSPQTAGDEATPRDGPVRILFERVAAAGPDLRRIGSALLELAADLDCLMPWVARLGDRSAAIAIHAPARGPRLMLAHRRPGQMSATHDHGTWVAITPVTGVETHRTYRVIGPAGAARLELADDRSLAGGNVATLLPPNDVHEHGHLVGAGEPAYVLVLSGDDQSRLTRTEWDLATGRQRILRPGQGGRWLASEPMPID